MCKAKTRSFSLSKVEGNLLGDLIDYETFSGTQKLTNVMNDVNFNQE